MPRHGGRRSTAGRAAPLALALACVALSAPTPVASRAEPHVPTARALPVGDDEKACVLLPLEWDPHLDWNAGPPC